MALVSFRIGMILYLNVLVWQHCPPHPKDSEEESAEVIEAHSTAGTGIDGNKTPEPITATMMAGLTFVTATATVTVLLFLLISRDGKIASKLVTMSIGSMMKRPYLLNSGRTQRWSSRNGRQLLVQDTSGVLGGPLIKLSDDVEGCHAKWCSAHLFPHKFWLFEYQINEEKATSNPLRIELNLNHRRHQLDCTWQYRTAKVWIMQVPYLRWCFCPHSQLMSLSISDIGSPYWNHTNTKWRTACSARRNCPWQQFNSAQNYPFSFLPRQWRQSTCARVKSI